MPRYFFHVHDGLSLMDMEGTELPDLTSARQEAVRTAGRMLKDDSVRFWASENWRMDVTDEAGLNLFSLHFLAVDAPVSASSSARLPLRLEEPFLVSDND